MEEMSMDEAWTLLLFVLELRPIPCILKAHSYMIA
jgi:hypothetical protein